LITPTTSVDCGVGPDTTERQGLAARVLVGLFGPDEHAETASAITVSSRRILPID
jgi:hypothetical protein